MQAGSPFPLSHYGIGSLSSHYLQSYNHNKQPNSIFSLCLHLLHCYGFSCILFCEVVSSRVSMLASQHEMMFVLFLQIEEYGIMELLELAVSRCGQKQKNFLEWPNIVLSSSSVQA